MKRFFTIIFALIILSACQAQPIGSSTAAASEGPTALIPIRLPVGYIPNVQFAPLYVAIEKGFFREQGLDVTLDYSAEIDSVALVGAGELPFAIASGEQVLLGRGRGLPLVYTLAWYQDYPVGVVSLKEAGINTPADLKGKRIGIPMLSGASYIGLSALLSSAGLTEQDVSLDVIGFTQLESLVSGRDDAVVVYAANEPVQLEAKGYATHLLRTSDYSNLVGNGLVTSDALIEQDPGLVQKMTTAILQGIMFATDNPDEAYAISRKFVENLDENDPVQKAVLAKSIEMWKSSKPGYSIPGAWENMQNVLLGMGLLAEPLDLTAAYTNEFWPGK
jgi:NitT/TauT family transport system substrate-binding protein